MAKPLTDQERQDIIDLLGTGKSCSEIARITKRSSSTVSLIARSVGHRFGQSNTERAREARSAYGEEARAAIAATAAERARAILDGFDATQPVVAKSEHGSEVLDLELDARGQKDRAAAAQILMRTALDIDKHDRKDAGAVSEVDAWLADMTGAEVGAS